MFHVPEKYRIKTGPHGSDAFCGNNGVFLIRSLKKSHILAIASNGLGWEHVSASLHRRCPTWSEMCLVKNLFWDPDDIVMQLHPAQSEYINNHPFCLHLWRPVDQTIPTPDFILVGYKSKSSK